MRNALVVGLLVLLAACGGGGGSDGGEAFDESALGTLRLYEDWDSGLDENLWQPFGDPGPRLVRDGFLGSPSLDGNGDELFPGGVVSHMYFNLTEPRTVRWLVNAHAEFDPPLADWQSSFVGFSRTTAPFFPDEGPIPQNLCAVTIRPISPGGTVLYEVRDPDTNAHDGFEEPYDSGDSSSWVEYLIHVNEDGTVSFYREGALKFRSSLALRGWSGQALVIGGQSVGTTILIDEIVVRAE